MSEAVVARFGAYIIAGATASGKSALAIEVARRCGGEIIGADAFQVYAGLPVLTAQPTAAERDAVPHHLIGRVPLSASFDVAQYCAMAASAMAEIRSRGRIPLLVGGTGLYLRSLMRGIAELPTADAALRAQLEAMPPEDLVRKLSELDPLAASQVDLKNPRRVIRAVEVCLLTGKPFSSFRREWDASETAPCGVVIVRERGELCERIERRVDAMFAGEVREEVRAALAVAGQTASQAIGFPQVSALLEGRLNEREAKSQVQIATRQYAKRQGAWFRKEPALETVAIGPESSLEQLADRLATEAKRMSADF